MAHFVRPVALADSLDCNRYEIHLYAPRRFLPHLRNKPYAIGELASMPGERFLANIGKGAPLYPADVLRAYVGEERALFAHIRPDLVIGDMRLSLPVSARLERVRHAVIMNAYWSPYARRRSILPSLPLTRVIPPRLLGPVFRLSEPLAYRLHVRPINRVRREAGLAPLPPDIRVMYTEGDHVLYPDIPEFVPTLNAPPTHRYVGICPWTPDAVKPEWWERMRADPRPKVFISLGSSGSLGPLSALLRALAEMQVAVVLSKSGREVPLPPDAYVGDLLPFTETAREARLVVSHGGSGGLYPAMAAGTPVLAIPGNADQLLSTAVLVENGAGIGVRVEEAAEKRLRAALQRLLGEPRYREAAQQWSRVYARYDSGTLFRQFVTEILTS